MSKEVETFLKEYSPAVRTLAKSARKMVRGILPDAQETVDPGNKLIGYALGDRMKDTVCTIMPFTAHVNLGLFWGADLPDPNGLMEGTGKRHRHVKLLEIEDVKQQGLERLLKAALAAARKR